MGEEREAKGSTARKLKRSVLVARRGRTCTTPPPKWRLEENDNPSSEFLSCAMSSPAVSARKLCAHLWENVPLKNPGGKMTKRALGDRRRLRKSDGLSRVSKNLADQPEIAGNFDRAASASMIQCRRSSEKNVSPERYGSSSLEVTPYKTITPSISVDSKLKMLGSNGGLKPLLNKIWRLEEQNSMNVSLVRTLKTELNHARGRIKELSLEKESENVDRKLFSKSLRSAIESARDELEDERKLRKRSESLHRNLAREYSKLKSAFENGLKELQRERKVRVLLENLCDEFAKGISENERELRKLHHKHGGSDRHDRLILHISEAWLDERIQMKDSESEHGIAEKITVVDKLGFDIATFLQSKQAIEPKSRRFSLESFALNGAGSAPRNLAGEDSSEIMNEGTEDLKTKASIKSNSPVGVWKSKLTAPDFEESEASSRWPRELDKNSLMAQLIEARLEKRRRSQARSLKGSI